MGMRLNEMCTAARIARRIYDQGIGFHWKRIQEYHNHKKMAFDLDYETLAEVCFTVRNVWGNTVPRVNFGFLFEPSIIFDTGKLVHISFEPSKLLHLTDIELWNVRLDVKERGSIHYIHISNA